MSKPRLLLLHGVTNSARIWDDVLPLLTDDFELIIPTARGHRDGPAVSVRPVTIASLVDDVERLLDDQGLTRVHIAGNSMGGWMALELARRGRAETVCALSPAGCWTPGAHDEVHATSTIRRGRVAARLSGPLAPLALRSARVRRRVLRDAAQHGDRITADQAAEIVRDLAQCVAATDLLGTSESLAPLESPECPITIAWSGKDRIFPVSVNGRNARNLVPSANFMVLEDVGHVPMIDDPQLCAATIRQTVMGDATE